MQPAGSLNPALMVPLISVCGQTQFHHEHPDSQGGNTLTTFTESRPMSELTFELCPFRACPKQACLPT